jgi:hypothetical protein
MLSTPFINVNHVVHAVHLLLDWRCNGLLQRFRVRTRIRCLDQNLRRNNIGELRGGQTQHGNNAHDHHDNGDDHGHNGPSYEEFRHFLLAF